MITKLGLFNHYSPIIEEWEDKKAPGEQIYYVHLKKAPDRTRMLLNMNLNGKPPHLQDGTRDGLPFWLKFILVAKPFPGIELLPVHHDVFVIAVTTGPVSFTEFTERVSEMFSEGSITLLISRITQHVISLD